MIVGAIDQEAVSALMCRRADLTPRFPALAGSTISNLDLALTGGDTFRVLFALPMNESGLVVVSTIFSATIVTRSELSGSAFLH